MKAATEKRALQAVTAVACLVPLIVGTTGVLGGPGFLGGMQSPAPVDVDSHFRYLSGIFLGVGIAFCTCVPDIEAKGSRLRMLGGFVVLGGLARLLSVFVIGTPSTGHIFGLFMELIAVPCLVAWQAGFARRWREQGTA